MTDPDLDILPQKARELLQNPGWVLLDIRTQTEREHAKVPETDCEADWLNWDAEYPAIAPTIESAEGVIVICRVGGRSAHCARRLREQGKQAYNLAGGINEWYRCGLPVETH